MFKNMFIIAVITAFSLVGCSNNSSTESTKVETPAQQETITETTQTIDDTQLVDTYTKEIDSYTTKVNNFVTNTQNVTPVNTVQEKTDQFNALDVEGDTLEDELDLLEDRIEADYTANKLSTLNYQSLDATVENLEEQIDQATDSLELLLGIED